MKKIRLRKSRCIGENPVFPEVFYQYLILYPDSLNFRDVLANKGCRLFSRGHRIFPKKFRFLMVEFLIKNLFCICGINFAGIRHPLTSIGFCHLRTCFALITFLILFILLLLSNSIRHDPRREASL